MMTLLKIMTLPMTFLMKPPFQQRRKIQDMMAGKKQAAVFLLQLKEKNKLPKPVIKEVVEGTADLLRNSAQRLKR